MINVTSIHIDFMDRPIGIVDYPQLGWIIESDQKNIIQKAFQIHISTDEFFHDVSYDSSWVYSDQSAHIRVNAYELITATKYYIRVRVQNNNLEQSCWSNTSYFMTGLVHNEWQAQWISGEEIEDFEDSKGTYVRQSFSITKAIKSGFLYSSALGLYHAYINGYKAGNDEMAPGWTSYHKRILYQTNDITHLLCVGENILGAHLGAGWYKGLFGLSRQRNNYGTQTAFLGQIHVTYMDGTKEIFATNSSSLSMHSPVIFSEIYDGETYDALKEINNWNQIGFDSSLWKNVNLIHYPYHQIQSQPGSKVKIIDEIKAVKVIHTPKNEIVIDFGQNMTGWVEFSVAANLGDHVTLRFFEVLDAEGNVYTANLRKAKQTINYICKGEGKETYHPHFTFHGFRYVEVCQYPNKVIKENFIAYSVHSEMKRTGYFGCSNQDINQLQHNILWSLKSNFLDIPSDCPQRDERLGWTGDAQIFCQTASYLVNTHQFFSKWLSDLALDQTSEGGVPHVIPDILTGKSDANWLLRQGTDSAAAWSDAAVINPWVLYLTFGDLGIIKNQYASMKGWIDFMTNHSQNGIWSYKLQFGDWVALDAVDGSRFGATPTDLICSAYYAYSTRLFAKMAKRIGQEQDYNHYMKLAEDITQHFGQHFFDAKGNLTAQTQTAHTLALHFDLTPKKYIKQTVNNLVALIQKENGHLVTGFVGTPYLCHALSRYGKIQEAYDLLLKDDLPSWLYQVKHGATTIWEHWDGLKPDGTMCHPSMNSFNHYAYGAIGEWLYRVIAGIEIDEENPGYKHAIIRPMIGTNLDNAFGSYESIYGTVSSKWEKLEDCYVLKVSIPANTDATIYLSQAKCILDSDGLLFKHSDNGFSANCGSGEYTFRFQI